VIKYLYSLVDSLRLRSPKKIRPYQKNKQQASPACRLSSPKSF
jgi:hypothetical protein